MCEAAGGGSGAGRLGINECTGAVEVQVQVACVFEATVSTNRTSGDHDS